ncbi:MAG: AAA family ATPase [Cyanobacteria bacterium P01_E01_bin.42]
MLKSLKIENFRRFKLFELEDLGRVNLLVGMNNSGKTSILEAIQLLRSQNLQSLVQSLRARGEYTFIDDDQIHTRDIEYDICHLFCGHEIDSQNKCLISSIDLSQRKEKLSLSVSESLESNASDPDVELDFEISGTSNQIIRLENFRELIFNIDWIGEQISRQFKIPLSTNGGLRSRDLLRNINRFSRSRIEQETNEKRLISKIQFLSSSSLQVEEMKKLFDQISLMPEEGLIYDALQTIEPTIQRIVTVGEARNLSSRGGFFVRLSDSDRRIPLGSLGDGIWRMLGLTLALINAKGGILLVDEIDTGLHFTALSDMWKLIWTMAKQLDVQVFATTHSGDCWQSLASIASLEETEQDGITIQRIEKDKQKTVIFPREGIVIAAEDEIEVR